MPDHDVQQHHGYQPRRCGTPSIAAEPTTFKAPKHLPVTTSVTQRHWRRDGTFHVTFTSRQEEWLPTRYAYRRYKCRAPHTGVISTMGISPSSMWRPYGIGDRLGDFVRFCIFRVFLGLFFFGFLCFFCLFLYFWGLLCLALLRLDMFCVFCMVWFFWIFRVTLGTG